MRLTQIKIVGFKSFVEATKLNLARPLTAIVGPNGCGKSNSLDAVRWVMGESSARELRGGEMNDVLFSGSDQRAPVSQCSVELLFDNSSANEASSAQAALAGPFGQLTEIAVKRVHHREEGTRYYLNNQPCRRRDVLDLFNGTGLGPRSYALIGQGSISRIIEAKPIDLRQYIEEVAGIAGYRQRRKETLSRLNKAQDNLNQLSLLQEELQQQHQHLVRQAEQAQAFQDSQQRIKTLSWQVYQTKWYQTLNHLADLGDRLRSQQQAFSETKQAWDEAQQAWIAAKQQRQANQQAWQAQTQAYHQLDKAVSRLQQQQDFIAQQTRQQQQLTEHLEQQKQQAESALVSLKDSENALRQALDEWEVEQESQLALLDELGERIANTEMQQSQYLLAKTDAESRVQRLNQQCQQAELSKQDLWRQIEQAKQQQAWLAENLVVRPTSNPSELPRSDLQELRERITASEAERSLLAESVQKALACQQRLQQQLQLAQQDWQSQQAHYQALCKLQQSWQQQAQAQLDQSIHQQISDKQYQWLIDLLVVDPDWQPAVTAWLGPRIHGLVASHFPAEWLGSDKLFSANVPFIVWTEKAKVAAPAKGSLAEVIKAPIALHALANSLQRRDTGVSLQQQIQMLSANEAIIDRDGRLFFPQAWQAPYEGEGAIYLARADEIASLEQQLPALEHQFNLAKEALAEQDQQLQTHQQAWQTLQAQLPIWQEQLQALEQQQAQEQARQAIATEQQQRYQLQLEQVQKQVKALEQTFEQTDADLEMLYDQLDQAQADLDEPQAAWTRLEQTKQPLLQQQQRIEQAYTQQQAQHQADQQRWQTLQQQKIQYQQQLAQAQQGIAQLPTAQIAQSDVSTEALADQVAKLADMSQDLTRLEQALADSEQWVEQAEQQAQTCQQAHQTAQQELETTQQQLSYKQEQLQQLSDQIKQDGLALPSANLPAELTDRSLHALEAELREARKRVQALGKVNMTAIDERDQLAARLEELEHNYTDIAESIAELEQAILALDHQSRTQLLDCFEQVNQGFAELFPQLFKGGKAALSWLSHHDDPLEDGLAVMAQPPGKRNSRIQLLSGGEKTLTALALIFAIFQLRPAPFCILDEVDAPLDDSNVIRFCGLVRSLSEKVQFIIITHNKTTMAMAHQLLGVSMNEPGVSRLVSVDLAKAVEMIGDDGA
ncbi:chromosome segregation protein SMC [Thiomicrospira sp. ALE5]|uniref:chromosome segregation protein SMC n=1 Tax=Thiomicrospira sp. ALE5 TaxID=748650 RepID=UPI0008F31454|nr:chromosome segregation protein SMC [Thiomicrospira sp. ALE5]SFR50315.1 condensin subunit Smc [Thiomicrospira sp. ALE5]